MENTKLENWTKRMINYVNKCSNHLFINESGQMLKIIAFEYNGKKMYARVKIRDGYHILWMREIKAYGGNSLNELKDSFFKDYMVKYKSIKNFKKARELTSKIKQVIEDELKNNPDSLDKRSDIEFKIKRLMKDVNFLKKNLTV